MSRVMGRLTLLTEVRHHLEQGRSVALAGPAGIGKSALLDAVEAESDCLVLRASGVPSEQSMPYAALQDLLDQVPGDVPAPLGGEQGRLVGRPVTDELRCAVGYAVRTLVEGLGTEDRPVLLLLDDAHWLDADSAGALGYARRRLGGLMTVVATVEPGAGPGVDLTGLHRIDVPPLDAGDMIELLAAHGLAAHTAQRLHVESGGVPALALALCGVVGARPSVLGRPTALPPTIEQVLRERFLAQPQGVRITLGYAALLHRPSVRQLERAGRIEADDELRTAQLAGMVARTGDAVRFTPPALRSIVVELATEGCRGELHRELAEVAPTLAEQLRHRALADPRPDVALARALASSAVDTAATGPGSWPPSCSCWPPTGRRSSSRRSGSSGWRRPWRPAPRATTASSCTAPSSTSSRPPPPRPSWSGSGSRCWSWPARGSRRWTRC